MLVNTEIQLENESSWENTDCGLHEYILININIVELYNLKQKIITILILNCIRNSKKKDCCSKL